MTDLVRSNRCAPSRAHISLCERAFAVARVLDELPARRKESPGDRFTSFQYAPRSDVVSEGCAEVTILLHRERQRRGLVRIAVGPFRRLSHGRAAQIGRAHV